MSALCFLGFLIFVFPPDRLAWMHTHTLGDGGDAVSFLFIFHRLGSNLVSWASPLWDGKMLFPADDSLIFSETMVLPSLFYRGLLATGSGTIFSFNLLLLLFFWGNVLSGYWCARKFFSRTISTLLAMIFCFSLIRLAHLLHAHCLPQWGFPLAAGCLIEWERTRRRGYAIGAGVATALQCYLSVTLGMILLISLLPYLLWRLWGRSRAQANGAAILAALIAFTVVTAPLGTAYVRCSLRHQFKRELNNAVAYGANPKSFFVVPAQHRYGPWLVDGLFGGEAGARHEKCLFIGFTGYLLLFLGAWAWRRKVKRSPERALYYTLLAFVILVSMGWNAGLYNVLYYVIPLMKGIRTPSRFGFSYLFLILFLIGYGLSYLHQRYPRPLARIGITLAVALGFIIDNQFLSPAVPIDPALAPTTQFLAATSDRKPVLHLPVRSDATTQALQMYYSLFHNHPIGNGYSGFLPPLSLQLQQEGEDFVLEKDSALLTTLHELGFGYLIFEKGKYDAATGERVRQRLTTLPVAFEDAAATVFILN